MTQAFIQHIRTVKLKKKKPVICALSTCREEIPEGFAACFYGKRTPKYTHDYHRWNYVDELAMSKYPFAGPKQSMPYPQFENVKIEYV